MIKKIVSYTLIGFILFVFSGCATWEGIKQDTSNAYDATKEAIDETFN